MTAPAPLRPVPLRCLVSGLIGLAFGLTLVSSAAAVDQELCLRYPVETVDSGLGVDFEDYYALNDQVWPYWKARGAAYQVLDPDSMDLIQEGYASSVNGCFTLAAGDIPAGETVVVVFYLDSLMLDHLHVRTRGGFPQEVCDDDPFADHSGEPEWCQPLVTAAETGPLVGPGKKYLDFFAGGPEGTLQALAAFPAYWWHHFDPAALDYDMTISVRHADGCAAYPDSPPCSNAGLWYPDQDREVLINIDDQTEHKYRQKFLVGHEVGHAIEKAYQNARFGAVGSLSGSYGYFDDPPDPACDSAGEAHALTSIEVVSAAIAEGFAHFVAADSYNDHGQSNGRFTYYKDDLGFPRDIELEGETAFAAAEPHRSNRYAERVCAPTVENSGTELDWLRFFWDLHSGPGADGDHENILHLRVDGAFQGTTWDSENGFDLLLANVCDGPPEAQLFQTDFLQFAGSDDGVGGNGVDPQNLMPICPP